ncbi:MAG: hypothetical protein OXU23_11160 [Candidatus Poribacteria bacterium]|nr:hypothetical protein [Candidatus Poribacteria bacterium]
MFIEKLSTPLEFRRNDISTANALQKHIVPTGLKSRTHIREILKLTRKDRAQRNPTDEL